MTPADLRPAGAAVRPASTHSAAWHVAPDHPAFAGHFSGHPWLPGVALLTQVLETALAHAAIIEALRRRVDHAFLPRRLIDVAALPREATGKLPAAVLNAWAAKHLPALRQGAR